MLSVLRTSMLCAACCFPTYVIASEPLHQRIDALILAGAKGQPASPLADDAEFLRRVYLDLAGRIPSAGEARVFLNDQAKDKRTRIIDQLLASPEYPRHMTQVFHVMLMERLGENAEWTRYLQKCFETNKPWDQMSRDMLRGSADDETTRGAVFFYSKRLENYGQNPVDYPALARDVGRLFLGADYACAQCHDHRFIKDYKQLDFQGLYAFFQNTFLVDANMPSIGEKPTTEKLSYQSVFNKVKRETFPRIPGVGEVEVPKFKKGEEYVVPADVNRRGAVNTKKPGKVRFSVLEKLAEQLPMPTNAAFNRNIANRLWFVLMGRGMVHPLDLSHKDNPPSHPELLDLIGQEMAAHRYDIKWMLRELALSQTYQRSSILPAGQDKAPPESSFLVALEKRLSAEQLLASIREATGVREKETAQLSNPDSNAKKKPVKYSRTSVDGVLGRFVKAFANQPREPEVEFNPSLKAALFLLNDDTVLAWLKPQSGNLAERLSKIPEADKLSEELYLSVLTRLPSAEEKAELADYLSHHASRREAALQHLAWALLASTEFCVNH